MTRAAAVLAALVAASGSAAADDAGDARRTAGLFLDAIFLGDPAVAAELMAGTVAFDLAAPACPKAYQAPGRATGKTRVALAACLVELGRLSGTVGDWQLGASPITAAIAMYNGDLALELVRVKGKLRVAAVRFGPVPAEEIAAALAEEARIAASQPPPPPPPPRNVPPTLFEQHRIAGDKAIVPDDVTKTEIARSGKDRVTTVIKVCLDEKGAITSVIFLKKSTFDAYDRKLDRELRKWRYKPYLVDGAPATVCSTVTFHYAQK